MGLGLLTSVIFLVLISFGLETQVVHGFFGVFGADCSSFKSINLYLHINTKRMLVKFHWQIYGLAVITNNEFMMWLVKGYITELKGHFVNWALIVPSTIKEKARKQEVKGLKSGSIDNFI